MTTGYLYSPLFLEHAEPGHPESPERLAETMRLLKERGLLSRLTPLDAVPATDAQLETVHTPEMIARVKGLDARGGGHLDSDTYVSRRSLAAARLAAGAVVRAVDAVMAGEVDNALALVRPPGHHATRSRSMGFCLFNNLALAAQHALDARHLDRVLVVDYDVHHGNGTEDIFYRSPRVLYFSTHQWPFYPGTGDWRDIGAGEGVGYNVNVPLPAHVNDEGYQRVFDDLLYPVAERYRPQLVLVSVGFDAHWRDPLAMESLSLAGYAALARTLIELAREQCEGRIVFTLEGGYDIEVAALGAAGLAHLLLGDDTPPDPIGPSRLPGAEVGNLVEQLRALHRLV